MLVENPVLNGFLIVFLVLVYFKIIDLLNLHTFSGSKKLNSKTVKELFEPYRRKDKFLIFNRCNAHNALPVIIRCTLTNKSIHLTATMSKAAATKMFKNWYAAVKSLRQEKTGVDVL